MGKKLKKNVPVLRFPEFEGDWETTTLEKVSVFHDKKRIPLSSEERQIRQGEYPYYGASGIIDYIDNYIFDGTYVLLAEDGANIINRSTPIAFIAEGKFWVNNHAHILKAKGSNHFLVAYLENLSYDRYNTGTAQPKLNADVCKKIIIKIPSIAEQEKIASFLGAVDTRLNQLRRKRELLQTYKRGVMQKIFSQKIRFKDAIGSEFADWEERKLGDFLIEHQERVNANTHLPIYSSSREGLKPQKEYFSDRELKNEGEYGVVPKNFFVYRHMSDDLTFKFNINDTGEDIAVSKEYPIFTTKNINSKFILLKLNYSDEFKIFAVMQKRGGTRTRLYYKNLASWKTFLPEIREQEKIANFITAIDRKLEILSRQIDQTEKFKKGLLQKLFI
ncbi:MAG: restriction endonuclease subunit S [Mojavia pulchra JT2-VF2]|jgi:type I restriction enzyme S subunit|uniref:Restriction endonuclease subunit S n=1 Tax=Mojavia pulchra JT2-VF2 TaxID=287848 RepID=A0A951PYQ1_9NOST|nr:restriction endonuclease subunit S [Mojavia pulchra JT2-VF2]